MVFIKFKYLALVFYIIDFFPFKVDGDKILNFIQLLLNCINLDYLYPDFMFSFEGMLIGSLVHLFHGHFRQIIFR